MLPEGDDDRILRAASRLLARSVADLTILGEMWKAHPGQRPAIEERVAAIKAAAEITPEDAFPETSEAGQ